MTGPSEALLKYNQKHASFVQMLSYIALYSFEGLQFCNLYQEVDVFLSLLQYFQKWVQKM